MCRFRVNGWRIREICHHFQHVAASCERSLNVAPGMINILIVKGDVIFLFAAILTIKTKIDTEMYNVMITRESS